MGNVVFATSTLCSNPYINTCTIFYHSLEAHKKFIEENLLKDNKQLRNTAKIHWLQHQNIMVAISCRTKYHAAILQGW